MNRRRTDRALRLELLRARAAADRIELSLARRDIADRLHPLRRAADSIGSVAGALGKRGSALRWLVAAGAALTRARRVRQALAGAAASLHSGAAVRVGAVALGALVVGAAALVVRRTRRSERPVRKRREPAGSGGRPV
jgi:hypothetical protein